MTSLTRCLVPVALCVSVFLLAACERTTLPTVPIPPEQDPARIEITPSVLNLTSIDLTQKLSAEVFDVDDEVISYAVVSWSSSDLTVAAVSPQGDVVARKLGVAQITARYKDVSASVDVTVTQVIGSIEIHPIVLTLSVGSSTNYLLHRQRSDFQRYTKRGRGVDGKRSFRSRSRAQTGRHCVGYRHWNRHHSDHRHIRRQVRYRDAHCGIILTKPGKHNAIVAIVCMTLIFRFSDVAIAL